jgi:ABC-type branched-subunit amino acid transport system ATPase component
MSGEMAVEVRGLRKAYGDYVAVDDVSLSIADGEIGACRSRRPGRPGCSRPR